MSLRTTTLLLAVGLFCTVNVSNAQAFDLLERFVNMGASQKSKGCDGCGHAQKSGAKQRGPSRKHEAVQKRATQRSRMWGNGPSQKGVQKDDEPKQKGGKGSWFSGVRSNLGMGGPSQKGDAPKKVGSRQKIGSPHKSGPKQK